MSSVAKKMKDTIAKRSHNFVPLQLCTFATLKYKTNPKRTQTNPIFWTPNPILSQIMGIFDKFRKTFLCKTNPFGPFKNLNTIILFLARSFFRIQGLGRIQNGAVPMYREYLNLSRKRSSRQKKPLKRQIYEHFMQNKPNGMLFKPNFDTAGTVWII